MTRVPLVRRDEFDALPTVADRNSGAALRRKLSSNQDCVWVHLGDSTANGNDEWLYLALDKWRADFPNMRVTHELWNDTTQAYDAASVVQAGVSDNVPAPVVNETFSRTGNLVGTATDTGQVWTGGSLPGWTTDGSVLSVGSAGEPYLPHGLDPFDPAGVRFAYTIRKAAGSTALSRFMLYRSGPDELFVEVTSSATNISLNVYKRVAGAATGIASGQSFVVDNSAERVVDVLAVLKNGTITVSFTHNGVTKTTSGALGLTSTWNAFVNGRSLSLVNTTSSPDKWDNISAGFGGAEPKTLRVINGSMPGASFSYQQTRVDKMVPVEPDLVTFAGSHNNGTQSVAAFQQQTEDLVNAVLTKYPNTGVVLVSQNPQFPPKPADQAAAHNLRIAATGAHARSKNWGYIAAAEKFLAQPDRGKSLVSADGIHPAPAGWPLWRDAALEFLRGDPGKADKTYVDSQIGGLSSTYVPQWKPSTAYAAGQLAVSPDGQVIKANAAFTSGATYDASKWTATVTGKTAGKVYATGSSITYGIGASDRPTKAWLPLLPTTLGTLLPDTAITVVNGGVGGEGTVNMLPRLAAALRAERPQFALLETSPNDFRNDVTTTAQQSADNLAKMVAICRMNGVTPVLWTNAPMIPAQVASGTMDADSVTQQLATNDLVRALASNLNVILADPYPVLDGVTTSYLADGLHPNDYGHSVIAQVIANAIAGIAPPVIYNDTVVVSDNFDRANSTTTLGGAWVPLGTAVWGINTNRAFRYGSGAAFDVVVQDATQADHAAEATVNYGGTNRGMGLGVRVVDVANYLEVYMIDTSLNLAKVVGGTRTTLASWTTTHTAGTPYVVKAEAVGNAITVWEDGVQRITYTLTGSDATTFASATKAGLYAQYSNSSAAWGTFDNFTLSKRTAS